MSMIAKICSQCGAPFSGNYCKYCGTSYVFKDDKFEKKTSFEKNMYYHMFEGCMTIGNVSNLFKENEQ